MKYILMPILVFSSYIGQAQIFRIGEKEIEVKPLTKETFDIRGTWKIIYHDFYTEDQIRKERINMAFEDPDYNKLIKEKSSLYLGKYVSFSDSLYQPYASYQLGKMVPNLQYQYSKRMFNAHEMSWEQETETYEFLKIDLYCAESKHESETFYALNEDVILSVINGCETYLEREKKPERFKGWDVDKEGFFFGEFFGAFVGDIDLVLPQNKSKIEVYFEVLDKNISNKEFFQYSSIRYLPNNDCELLTFYKRMEATLNPEFVQSLTVNLDKINSSFIRLSAIAYDEYSSYDYQFRIRWRFVN